MLLSLRSVVHDLLSTSRKSKEKGRMENCKYFNFEKVIAFPLCPHPCLEDFKIEEEKKKH